MTMLKMQMFKVALVTVGAASVAARIKFPSLIAGMGRSLKEIALEELPFPRGDVQHEVATSGSVDVDGTVYDVEYAPCSPALEHQLVSHAQVQRGLLLSC